MNTSSPNGPRWETVSYSRPSATVDQYGDLQTGGPLELVVVVTDGRGGRWDATVNGETVTSLTTHGVDGKGVTQRALRSLPLATVHKLAVTRAAEYRAAMASGARTADAHSDPLAATPASHGDDDPMLTGTSIPRAEFAAAWREEGARRVDEQGRDRPPRRQALAERYKVSRARIDDYVREARDHGDIAPASTGRKRASQTTGADRAESQNEENGR
ncbi:MAG: hypothetical protein ACTMH5_13380 [Brachybacterium sp.]|uniref:hypothetical protein n=1 Tax=Brachybacterium sp. TaxID=1891286 RepID=UPI003F934593